MAFPATSPYLSIVLTARNDNYGGDFNYRLQNALRWLIHFIELNKLPAELLLVDYNPVAENKPLVEMLDWLPGNRNYLAIRLLHVPREIHEQLICPAVRKTVPLFEFVAKNMAIRRAAGEYILSTNADILFHPSLFRHLAKRQLLHSSYYRANRFDYKKIDDYDFDNPAATLRNIQRNVFSLHFRGHDFRVHYGENFVEEYLARFRNSCRLLLDFNLVKVETLAGLLRLKVNYENLILKYHTNASGDFMLMHRDHWFGLRGYPEDTYISTHCDAIFTVMARIAGLQQTILPWPVYHQHHARRYNTDFEESKKNNDIAVMFKRFVNDTREMEHAGKPKIVNPADWGHASCTFAETKL